MSFKIGDRIQLKLPTGWRLYGVVLAVKHYFGYPDEFTIRWEGEIMPDGDRTRGLSDTEQQTRIQTIYSCAELGYLEPQEWFCHT